MPARDEVACEVGIFRPNQCDTEIEIAVTVPASGDAPGRRLHVTLTPAAFALALTGRGAIRGKLREVVLAKAKRKEAC